MALSMKERNDGKAWEAYEKAGEKLKAEVMEKRKAIAQKYKNVQPTRYGMDGGQEQKELGEISRWFGQEVKKLREQSGIK